MRYVALLRSINVGKHNRITMAALRAALDRSGLPGAETYLQSGNVLFEWDPERFAELDDIFESAFRELNVSSHAVIRSAEQMIHMLESDPFAPFDVGDEHKFVTFMKAPMPAPLPVVSKRGDVEVAFQSDIDVCFVSRPIEGVHRGLTAPAGIPATSRNWTVTKDLVRLLGK